ncbi:hypothetical protein BU17DRAFT_81285 [Hysterangium stoloniferum]|nr:hypothetical protein BU17DRAFT_81285 [Hysterangium stoloniferum]
MATIQHYLWASGHILLLAFSLRYFWAYVTFKSGLYTTSYKTAIFGALISYAIVCYKGLGVPSTSSAFIQKALTDENAQYFLLAMFWWFSKPIPVALLPYTVFSLFHALTFVRTTVLPMVLPPPPPAPGANAGAPPQSQIGKAIHNWVKTNYDGAMRLTALAEFVILLRVVIGALTFQNSFLIPIVYAHFLRQRYYHSAFTRDALKKVNGVLDRQAANPSFPPMVNQIWLYVKKMIGVWAGNTIVPQESPSSARRAPTPRA